MASIKQKQSLGKAKQNKKNVRPLTKEEKNAILKRMSEIRRYKNDPKTVQNTIPYLRMFKDGICQVTDNFYSKTIQFFDTNYTIADEEEQDSIFEKYTLSHTIKMPCTKPHTTNCQLAPCQKPVAKNTINRFIYVRSLPLRLPPRGM